MTVGVERDGERVSLTVPEGVYSELGSPRTGDSTEPECYRILLSEDEKYRASMYALRILSYADNNLRTLIRKLCERGISRPVAEEVAEEMLSRGYVNEHDQLMRLIKREANENLNGPRKIKPKLMARGYSGADIDRAMHELCETGEVDFELSRRRLVEKKLTRDATEEEIKKLLYKNGYSVC